MAKVHKQFEEFDGKIRLGRFKEEETLREKRNIIRDKLRDRLPAVFEGHNEENLVPDFRDQGSYEMGTGVKPLDDDFDIDQGVYFATSMHDYDPVALKERVHEALDGHTESVRIRRPCVTVQYKSSGQPLYHVDLAVYSAGSENDGNKDQLAVGLPGSTDEKRYWEPSDPAGLSKKILDRFEGTDRAQFRRVVRCLKRWKDERFSLDGNQAPTGIGLTVAAYDNLECRYHDVVSGKHDHLSALRGLVRAMLARFHQEWDAEQEKMIWRLKVTLPVDPMSDLFEKMSNRHMAEFKAKLERLLEAMDFAADALDPVDACEELKKVFGDDFPVPDRDDTGKKQSAAAVVGSTHSASSIGP